MYHPFLPFSLHALALSMLHKIFQKEKCTNGSTSRVSNIYYSPNCVQIWKGRDQKTVFCRVRCKKCRAKVRLFLSHPVKNSFLIETFLYKNKILRTHNFFCRDCTFFKRKRTGKLLFTALDNNVQITSLLRVKLVKEVD